MAYTLVLPPPSSSHQMANTRAQKLFGFRARELEGRNISLLMPQPFSGRHNTYLATYLAVSPTLLRITLTLVTLVGILLRLLTSSSACNYSYCVGL